jgi:hypothetical protein
MMDTIAEGRAAWAKLQERDRASWDEWLCVGRALVLGRNACMKIAGVNAPKGGKYNYAAEVWLAQNGFSDMWPGERHRIVKIVENLPAVERWRASLPPARRQRINHPSAWLTYLKESHVEVRARPAAHRPLNHGAPKTFQGGGYRRPVQFDQDTVRRAAMAMRENWHSGDVFKIAAIALAAAIRHEDDLISLFPPPPKPRPAPKPEPLRIAAPVLELTA